MLLEGVDFFLDEFFIDFDFIDIELFMGKEVSIEDFDSGSGFIFYYGCQVFLYIWDYLGCYDVVIVDGEKGKCFYIVWCRIFDEMCYKNWFERYYVINCIDGLFEIDDGLGWSQDVDLWVCMNCFEWFNYKGSIDK